MWRDFVRTSVFLTALTLLFPVEAWAYIDPGLGSLIFQGLAAGAISALLFWRDLRRKVKDFFTGRGAGAGKAAPAEPDERP
jgi:hypothetical protein